MAWTPEGDRETNNYEVSFAGDYVQLVSDSEQTDCNSRGYDRDDNSEDMSASSSDVETEPDETIDSPPLPGKWTDCDGSEWILPVLSGDRVLVPAGAVKVELSEGLC